MWGRRPQAPAKGTRPFGNSETFHPVQMIQVRSSALRRCLRKRTAWLPWHHVTGSGRRNLLSGGGSTPLSYCIFDPTRHSRNQNDFISPQRTQSAQRCETGWRRKTELPPGIFSTYPSIRLPVRGVLSVLLVLMGRRCPQRPRPAARQKRPTCRRRGRGGPFPREDIEDDEDAAAIMIHPIGFCNHRSSVPIRPQPGAPQVTRPYASAWSSSCLGVSSVAGGEPGVSLDSPAIHATWVIGILRFNLFFHPNVV